MGEVCLYCGNNPVNHFSTRFGNSLGLWLQPKHPASFFQRLSSRTAHAILRGSLSLFCTLGIAKLNDDTGRAPSARGHVLWEEAMRRGIRMQNYLLAGRSTDTYRAEVRGKTIIFSALPRPVVSESGAEHWLDDKWLLKQALLDAGIPVPRGGCAKSFEEAKKLFVALTKPVVVKPRIGSRGRHTSTHIYKEGELREAFKTAKELCPQVVVEEHIEGAVYRGTVIGGKLVGVLAGEPPRVTGNGQKTLRKLVKEKNAARNAKVHAVRLDRRHEEFLARTGNSPDSIPKAGEVVDLIEKIGVSYGGHSAEVTRTAHPETKKLLERAAAVVDDPVIGFDFIIPDIARAPGGQKWGIVECNSLPFINLHHDPVEGEPVNVAAALWDYVEGHIEKF